MSLNTRKIYVDLKTGKISLSKSIRQCNDCHHTKRQTQDLKRELFLLKNDLAYHKKRQEQMNILCEEIQKTKVKLQNKVSLKNKYYQQRDSPSPTDITTLNRDSYDQEMKLSFLQRPKTVYSFDLKLSNNPSTDRSMNI